MPSPLHSRNYLAHIVAVTIRGYRGRVANGKRTWEQAIAIVAPELYADELPIVLKMIDDRCRRKEQQPRYRGTADVSKGPRGQQRHIRRKGEPFS